MQKANVELHTEDILRFIVSRWREGAKSQYSSYGYDIYLPNYMRFYVRDVLNEGDSELRMQEISGVFYAAAWELCRRGILRPGIKQYRLQETTAGNAGNGYSITPFGRQWIKEETADSYVPTEPERFAEMLRPYRDRFGPAFYERAQEAIRCYGAHAYLACCTMCGAASEAILLSTAATKVNDLDKVIQIYTTKSGRSRIENKILGQAKQHIVREFKAYTELLKYWRDYAAHGQATNITDNEAYTSLAMLLRFAMTVDDYWDELTS